MPLSRESFERAAVLCALDELIGTDWYPRGPVQMGRFNDYRSDLEWIATETGFTVDRVREILTAAGRIREVR